LKLSTEVQIADIIIFWMDNFSKVYVTDYNYKWSQVPWELRNLTASGTFIFSKASSEILDYSQYSVTTPLPPNDLSLWKDFYKYFKEELLETKSLTYANPSWLSQVTSTSTNIKLNLHTTFKPLELLQFNPSTLQGNLSILLYLKQKYPTTLPFTIVVADIAFVAKWWKYCLSSSTNGKIL